MGTLTSLVVSTLIALSSVYWACEGCRRSLTLPQWPMLLGPKNDIAVLPSDVQGDILAAERLKCYTQMYDMPYPTDGVYCNRTWDNIMCWGETVAGTQAVQKCANYINGFNVTGVATRQCMDDGTWFLNPASNRTWTNYIGCVVPSGIIPKIPQKANFSKLISEHIPHIQIIYNVGYSISLVSLILAVFIMVYFKKLHCPRNTIHIHLFLSFILRAGISCLKEYLLVKGIGLRQDVIVFPDGAVTFNKYGSHWECRTLLTVFNYALMSNYFWVFVEALYLHMLIFVSVFSERCSILPYMAIGWGSPLLFIIPWVIVRQTLDNSLCWNTHGETGYFWILKAPIALSILVNFGFFLNVVRVLFTKLKASNTPEARKFRYRKLARSTLVLIPLFGVHYVIFLALPDDVGDTVELVKLYFEMFFSSFQGLLVALLFCFFNGEVQSEFKKTWERYRLRRGGSSFRSSRSGYVTTSTFFSRAGRASSVSIQSNMDTRMENSVMSSGTYPHGNGSLRNGSVARGSVAPTEKLIVEETEVDIYKSPDPKPLHSMPNPDLCSDTETLKQNGRRDTNQNTEHLLLPILLENGCSIPDEDLEEAISGSYK